MTIRDILEMAVKSQILHAQVASTACISGSTIGENIHYSPIVTMNLAAFISPTLVPDFKGYHNIQSFKGHQILLKSCNSKVFM